MFNYQNKLFLMVLSYEGSPFGLSVCLYFQLTWSMAPLKLSKAKPSEYRPKVSPPTSYSVNQADTFKLDLSRNCAAPLTAYYAVKENIYGNETNGRI